MPKQPQGLLVSLGSKGLIIFKDTLFVIIILLLCLICFYAYAIRILRFNIKKPYKGAQPTSPR